MAYSFEVEASTDILRPHEKKPLRKAALPILPIYLLLDSIRKTTIPQSDFILLNGLSFMATPAQLMKVVSDTTGVPLPTIVDIDRKLVKGKLRRKGGRGLHAARMTPLDAGRLLTAVLGSAQANTSVAAVERYAQTGVDRTRSSERLFGGLGLDDLDALPARHSFIDGLAALIASASTGAIAKLLDNSPLRRRPHIEVFAFTGATRGRIRIAGIPDGDAANVEYISPTTGTKPARGKRTRRAQSTRMHENAGDLEQSRRITERTILLVAELLAQESRQ